MKNLFHSLRSVAIALTAILFVNCSEDPIDDNSGNNDKEEPTQDDGLYSVRDPFVEIDKYGGDLTITFLAMGDWNAVSDSDWCTLKTESGTSGNVTFVLNVAPNPDEAEDAERTAKVSISIDGYGSDLDLCEIRQASEIEDQYTDGLEPNVWISQQMTRNYLWNDEFIKAKPKLNYWNEVDAFFNSALSRMENIEEDGGYYPNGERYYYSFLAPVGYVSNQAPATRAMSVASGFGINMLYTVSVGDFYYLLIGGVVEESAAANAGLRRGMYITAFDRTAISAATLQDYYNKLLGYVEYNSSVTLSISEYGDKVSDGLIALGDYRITPGYYTNNPIMFSGVFANEKEGKNVGYLVYSAFDMHADEELLSTFKSLKNNNVSDLIIDLRYNGGGDVYSSTLMATAVVGSKHKGEVYCHMDYNEYRKALGEVNKFFIGENPTIAEYAPIQEALDVSLDLERVYVITTGYTASASELVINGLRGLGVDVYVVGTTTEGKNVGMEVGNFEYGEYVYELAPITFYNLNAEGFKDFSDGFKPDYTHVETQYALRDWGQGDTCVDAALSHIYYNTWPKPSLAPTRNGADAVLPVVEVNGAHPRSLGARVYDAQHMSQLK